VSAGHTQRLLVVSSQDDMPTGAAQFDGVTAHPDLFVLYHDNAKADARRLVACWNACEGIETYALELMTGDLAICHQITASAKASNKPFTHKAVEYRRQRDELITALQQLHRVCMAMDLEADFKRPTEEAYLAATAAAAAAIAKATGGTS
jgi:hypothetical protein